MGYKLKGDQLRAAVSSKDAFNDLFGRRRTAAASAKFLARPCHHLEKGLAAAFCQAALQNLHKRFLFFDAQFVGPIEHLSKSFHGWADMPAHPRMQGRTNRESALICANRNTH